jgi:hypothetical protein
MKGPVTIGSKKRLKWNDLVLVKWLVAKIALEPLDAQCTDGKGFLIL